jgi:hypothetical protein
MEQNPQTKPQLHRAADFSFDGQLLAISASHREPTVILIIWRLLSSCSGN